MHLLILKKYNYIMIKNIFKFINNNEYEINICNGKIYIMNYKNVIDLSNSFIKIELFDSYLLIKGDNLNIKKLDNRELLITGKIKGIDFNDE